MNLSRIYDLHRIFDKRRQPISSVALMDRLSCSRSTLHRALSYLRDTLGAPVINFPGRGYFYDLGKPRFELPGLWFRPEELEALLMMDHLVKQLLPGPPYGLARELRKRLHQRLDEGTGDRGRFPLHRVRILPAHARRISASQLTLAATGVVERRQLAFTYAGRTAATVTTRTVSPQRLVHYRDQWYLDCWDEDGKALRTFAIDRMSNVKVLPAEAGEMDDAELDTALTGGYGLFAGPARDVARLIFTAERARWVADEIWHSDQKGQFQKDGSYALEVPYADPRELLGEILRHGAEVRVAAPQELAEIVQDHLDRAAKQYKTQGHVSDFDTGQE